MILPKFAILTRNIMILVLCIGFTSAVSARATKNIAPDFTLKSETGKNLKLSELRGKVIMINFWASWCGPCRQEMPVLDQLYKHYRPLDFTVLGVNVEQNPDDAKSLLKDVSVSFPILFDKENKVSKLYDIKGMPSTVLVDRDGNVRYVHIGYQSGTEQEYQEQIRTLIRE
jgi:thiol-disulfide isomerase/thioredoxin